MKPAIRIENLSKKYRIGARPNDQYRTLRETLVDAARAPWDRFRRLAFRPTGEDGESEGTFWALDDVSFEIQPGEVVGIIGRNGAGKSTLLKVLSRITEPTRGRVEFRGRIGSLLEVGTGFHPELTGRENIYLNGAILGMSRREVARKFDEIVAFSEIEKFLETPVKRYSSGMYVRLAFAVAAHLEPETLLVDEVLAVGDSTYQNRCINRLSELARSGRTVLFVSHNMDLIPRLCQRAVLLKQGRVVHSGPADDVVTHYLSSVDEEDQGRDLSDRTRRAGDGRATFRHVHLIDADDTPNSSHPSGNDLTLSVGIDAKHTIRDAGLAINLKTITGVRLYSAWTREAHHLVDLRPGYQEVRCRFRGVRIRPGRKIVVELWMESGSVMDHVEDAMVFDVVDGAHTDRFSSSREQGVVLCNYEWIVF